MTISDEIIGDTVLLFFLAASLPMQHNFILDHKSENSFCN